MITAAAMLLPCMPQLTAAASGSDLTISTVGELTTFRNNVNSGTDYAGKTIKLTADITLTDTWTPIGDKEGNPFKGTFNGNGNTISGLIIINNEPSKLSGLFGYVLSDTSSTATIKNLEVIGAISSNGHSGGIVAYLSGKGSTVSCCHSDVSITGPSGYNDSSAVGGIVGYNASGTVSDCYSTGEISGAYNVGGVVGWNWNGGTVSCCHYYNSTSGSVRITNGSTGKAVGAIIGENDGDVYSCRYLTDTANYGIGTYEGVEHQTTEVQSLSAEKFKDSSSISTNFPNWNFTRIWYYDEVGSYPVLQFNPYVELTNHIETVEQLVLLRDAVNAGNAIVNAYDTYYLDKDLDLSSIDNWEPIGTADHPFTKTFTSCDKHNSQGLRNISGLKITGTDNNRGLFGYNSGTINNLTLSGCNVSGSNNVGCLVGQNNGTIQNVTVAGTVTGTGDNVGGIAGSTTASISGCTNSATVTGSGNNVGGIAGYSTSDISYCDNSAAVSGTVAGTVTGSGKNVGGIAGSTTAEISGCTNNSTVTGSGKNVGGIAGYSTSDISYCDNSAAVRGAYDISTNLSDSVGGIVGYNESGTVTRCHSTSSSSVMGLVNIGGIAGKNKGTVKLSYNEGTVGKSYEGMFNVGGVVGSNDASGAALENCYNTGSVTASKVVGGVIGINIGTVSYCYNNGSVKGDTIGGVAGNNNGGSITSCYYIKNKDATSVCGSGSIDTHSRYLTESEFIDETNFIDWDFNNTSIWTLSKSAGAPIFFYLKVGKIEQEIGYYTDKGTRYDDATGFVIPLTSDGTTLDELYIKGTVSLGDKQQNFEAKVGTEITVKDINVGLVVVDLYNKDTTLAVYAMIE